MCVGVTFGSRELVAPAAAAELDKAGAGAPIPPMCVGGTAGLFAAVELDTYFIAITPPDSAFWP
jgi:hypothetical protein